MGYDVFISHSSKDKRIAGAICKILEKKGLTCWIAPRNIRSGESWPEAITKAVAESDSMVLVFSQDANISKDVANELILAAENNVLVVPLRIDSTKPKGVLQYYLAGAHWHTVSYPPTDVQLIKFCAAIEKLLLKKRKDVKGQQDGEADSGTDKSRADLQKTNFSKLIAAIFKYIVIVILVVAGLVYYYYENLKEKQIIDPRQETSVGFPVSTYVNYHDAPEQINDHLNLKAGNIMNYGLVAEQDGSIFSISSDDGNKIYVTRVGESRAVPVNDENSAFINVSGEWIYYVNRSQHNHIFKVRTDGSVNEELLTDNVEYLFYYDDWLYYVNNKHRNFIYKVRTDGTDRTRLTMDSAEFLFFDHDWIYFKNHNHGGRIYRIRPDGSELSQINKEHTRHFNVQDGWVYYVNSDDNDRIYKIMNDGGNTTRISTDSAHFINFKDDWIYYTNSSQEGRIYRIRSDGTGNERLNEQTYSGYLNIIQNWLYYVERDNNNWIQRLNLEGL